MARIFIQRRDLYSRQLDDGRYVCVRKSLTHGHLVAHLKGQITLGAYVLDQESRARFIVFDADDDGQMEALASMSAGLSAQGVPSYLEGSCRGGHLWHFFPQPIPGCVARLFGQRLLDAHDLSDIELFPKQDRLTSGPGSLIRLPFGVHRRSGQRYGFVTAEGQPIAQTVREQIGLLSNPKTVPASALKSCLAQNVSVLPPPLPHHPKPEPSVGTLSQRIKVSVSVLDFASRFVDLSPTGRALCPFHDDQNASFSVNIEDNYWHCWAGCGGGSTIDFYSAPVKGHWT